MISATVGPNGTVDLQIIVNKLMLTLQVYAHRHWRDIAIIVQNNVREMTKLAPATHRWAPPGPLNKTI